MNNLRILNERGGKERTHRVYESFEESRVSSVTVIIFENVRRTVMIELFQSSLVQIKEVEYDLKCSLF